MIKNFFAKLVGWNMRRREGWESAAAQRFQDESTRESELAKERQQMQQQRMREEQQKDQASENTEQDL